MLQKIRDYWSVFRTHFSIQSNRKVLSIMVLIAIAAAIPITVLVAQQQQTIKQHAGGGLYAVRITDQNGNFLNFSTITNPNVFIDLDLSANTGYYIPDSTGNNIQLAPETSQVSATTLDNTFSNDSVYSLNINKPIYSLSISADVDIKSDKGLVRVVLVDTNKKEYLVYEAYPLIGNTGTFSIDSACEETCALNAVSPSSLKIQLVDATIKIKSTALTDSVEKLNKDVQTMGIQSYANALEIKQENLKIKQINDTISKKGLRWTAGETSISKLSYEEKKKLFTKPDGTPVDNLPNLQGFEYYKGGIFEPFSTAEQNNSGLAIKNTLLSDLPTRWDWRNVHGENWMTSVKNQGTSCGSCWAFAATAATEANANLYFNRHLDLDLSEQDLISCSGAGSCNGGFEEKALDYYKDTGVIDEACFPYIASNTTCNKCSNWQSHIVKISGKATVANLASETELKEKIMKGGVLSAGIYSMSHAMALLGWETNDTNASTVWIWKNSWGENWGESGYVKWEQPLWDIQNVSTILTPITIPDSSVNINCVDKDNDEYCNWGISEQMPNTCPMSCNPQKDCDDSNPNITQCPIITIPPNPGPTILKGIYIINKGFDPSIVTYGDSPRSITVNSIADIMQINWKLEPLYTGEKTPASRTIQVTLKGIGVQKTYEITVDLMPEGINHPPVIDPIENKTVIAGEKISFTVTASDPDGDHLEYYTWGLPKGATFDKNTHIFSWTPLENWMEEFYPYNQDAAWFTIHFQVSDGKVSAFKDVQIKLVRPQPTATPTPSPTPIGKPSPCGNFGDINLDGGVATADAQLIQNYLVRKSSLSDQQTVVADVNADGKITISDALLIAQYAAGTRSTFPVCSISPAPVLTPPCDTYGDVDMDGKVTMLDASLVAKYVSGNTTGDTIQTDEQKKRADVNGDKKISIIDAMLIGQYVSGNPKTFPICE